MVAEVVAAEPGADVLARLDVVEAALDDMSVEAYRDLLAPVAVRVVDRLRRVESRIAAYRLAAVRTLDTSLGADAQTGRMLAAGFGRDRREAEQTVRTAKALDEAPLTEDALAGGQLGESQARVIASAIAGLDGDVTPEQKRASEEALIADAQRMSLTDLRRRALRVTDAFKPREEAAADENAALARREKAAYENTELWMADQRDGTWRGGFTIPEHQAHLLKTMLDAVAAPRRLHLEDHDDQPTHAQRQGRAFLTLVEHMPADGIPTTGGTPAVVTVNIDHDTLQRDVEAATLSTGVRLSAGELRRIACDAGILPKVFDGVSIPLDLGRSRRLFTPAQRLVITERDRGCVAPGCDTAAAWSEIHHWRQAWAAGGTTNARDGCCLCLHDHHHAHQEGWEFREADDGIIEIRRHPAGVWERNHRWRP